MKFYSALLALSTVWGTTAFAPKAPTFKGHTNAHPSSETSTSLKQTLFSAIAEQITSAVNGATPAPSAVNGATPAVSAVNGATPAASTVNGATPAASALMTGTTQRTGDMKSARNIWDTGSPVTVQGGSLRTRSFDPSVEKVQVSLKTDGRPLNANVELWQGPDNTPQKMAVYIEDGSVHEFSAVVLTPRSGSNAVAIRNTGQLEFPLSACVEADFGDGNGLEYVTKGLSDTSKPKIIQGGAVHTHPFDPSVASVAVLLETDGRPLNARIELMQGPNNNKQVMEVYTEDGMERPFFVIIDTPGTGNVVRIVNTATVEFPITASLGPHVVDENKSFSWGLTGWDMNAFQ